VGVRHPDTTVYEIQPGRGFKEAATILGPDFPGTLVRDGWAPHRRFVAATHQTSLAHLVRRCRTLVRDHGDRHFAPRVLRVLAHALRVRDRHRRGALSPHGLAVARGHLVNQLNALIVDPAGRAAPGGRHAHKDHGSWCTFSWFMVQRFTVPASWIENREP
jgi:hypothetical protein